MKKILGKILRKLGWIKPKPQPQVTHEDEVIFKIQENLHFQVYWKSLAIGTGPAVILSAYGQEVLKFDCFGKGKGHFHIAPNYDFRIFFEEDTAESQIKRSVHELQVNGIKYLRLQKDRKIRALNPNPVVFNNMLKEVESTLLMHHEKLKAKKSQL